MLPRISMLYTVLYKVTDSSNQHVWKMAQSQGPNMTFRLTSDLQVIVLSPVVNLMHYGYCYSKTYCEVITQKNLFLGGFSNIIKLLNWLHPHTYPLEKK